MFILFKYLGRLSSNNYQSMKQPFFAGALFFFSVLLFSSAANSQSKFEREVRINSREVPEAARNFVDKLHKEARVRWFKETNLRGFSFEAKTKIGGRKVSIEFSSDGAFEDLETEIRIQEIPDETRSKIEQYFGANYQRFKLEKIQRQYSGEAAEVLAYMKDKSLGNKVLVQYEIVISVKEEGSFLMREYLFDANGTFISRQKIVYEIPDNLIY